MHNRVAARASGLARPEVKFLFLFFVLLVAAFTAIAIKPVDATIVAPYTGFVAEMAGFVLRLLGEPVTVTGGMLSSPRFSVMIHNGCNGLMTSLVFVSAVLAFPARCKLKLIGVVGGLVAIQAVNLVRIVSLFYIGIFFPSFFNDAHIVVWQSVVILAGIALWVAWAGRAAALDRARS